MPKHLRHNVAISLSMLTGIAAMQATEPQLLDYIRSEGSAARMLRTETTADSPAAMFYAHQYSLSGLQLTGSYLHREQAFEVQTGRGHMLGNVEASSYMRLGRNTTVWGEATFSTGQHRDILWNNAGDYRLVGPYVLGDSIGGNLSTRSYSFMGGYSGERDGWTWGAQAAYLASISYRNRDPRDKIIISDLGIKIGASRKISSSYILAIGGTLRVYNQESDITFYNPNNDIRTYAITGLGTYYARFSGNSGNSTAYSGLGYGGNISWLPTSLSGAYITADFNYLPMRQILREYNNLELTRAGNYSLTVKGGYNFRTGCVNWSPCIHARFHRQLGFENLYGTSVGNNYIRIGRRRNYYRDRIDSHLQISADIKVSGQTNIVVEPALYFAYDHEDYRKPHRYLESSTVTPSLNLRCDWRSSDRLRLYAEATGAVNLSSAHRANLGNLNLDSGIGNAVVHNFAMRTSDATTAGGRLGADWLIQNSMCLCISALTYTTIYEKHGNAVAAEVAVGIKF